MCQSCCFIENNSPGGGESSLRFGGSVCKSNVIWRWGEIWQNCSITAFSKLCWLARLVVSLTKTNGKFEEEKIHGITRRKYMGSLGEVLSALGFLEGAGGLSQGCLGDRSCQVSGEIQPPAAELLMVCSGLERAPACPLPHASHHLISSSCHSEAYAGACPSVRPELSHPWGARPGPVGECMVCATCRNVLRASCRFLTLSFFFKPLVLMEITLLLLSCVSTEFCLHPWVMSRGVVLESVSVLVVF